MKQDRVVVVTGAASGIGRLVVERFLADGDAVVATDTAEEALKTLAGAQGHGARLSTVAADVSSEADCAIVAALTRERHGRCDVLVNVAGSFPAQSFDAMTAADFRQVIDVNLTGAFLIVKAMAPLLREGGWGRIVLIGSAAVFEGLADHVHYLAAKSGLTGLTRSLARVFGADGITVNLVTPGLTLTPQAKERLSAEHADAQIRLRAIPRAETAEDLVGAIAFLASPDADFITGQTLNVDGGKHML